MESINKIRSMPFPKQETYSINEINALNRFLLCGNPLSIYRGNWGPAFMGGEKVKKIEREWSDYMGGCHSLAVNSCTSALIIACGAIGLQPGDEVIVTPWSMSCSATAPMWWGAIPVFADISRNTFCLEPESIKQVITDKTKAIIIVDLFGHPFDVEAIQKIASDHGLFIIEDAAQSPGADWKDSGGKFQKTGLLGDIGCFSFTWGKHLTCGEGGMITTTDEILKDKCALIRNHAEAVLHGMARNDSAQYERATYSNMKNAVGMNTRMTELNAIILSEQLKKLDERVMARQQNVDKINNLLRDIPFIKIPEVQKNYSHANYVQPFLYDSEKAGGVHRDVFLKLAIDQLVGEEGRPDRPMISGGYIEPLYRFPLFQKNMHYSIKNTDYTKIHLPVVEKLWRDDFFLSMYHNLPLLKNDIKEISDAFHFAADKVTSL